MNWIDLVLLDVAELDYNSPVDQPTVMLVKAGELRTILESRAAELGDLAAERAALARLAVHRERVLVASKSCAARAFDQITNSSSQKMWQGHADDLNALLDVLDGRALGPNV